MRRRSWTWLRAVPPALAIAALAYSVPAAEPPKAPVPTREQLSSELKTMRVYQVMADHYPEHYRRILDEIEPLYARGATVASMSLALYKLNAQLFSEQLPKANVANTIASLELTRDEGAAALAVDPGYCLDVLGLRPVTSAPGLTMPAALVERELALMAEVLEQTARAPEKIPDPLSEEEVERLGIAAYDDLPADELRLAFGRVGGDGAKADDTVSRTAVCEFSLAFFNRILKLPPVEGARTFRALTATK